MKGNLQEMSVADLVQYSCQNAKTVSVTIEREHRRADIFIEKGEVVHAVMDNVKGENAIYQALAWPKGVFELRADIEAPEKTILASWPSLLLEGFRLLDEGLLGEEASREGRANLPTEEEKKDLLMELTKLHKHSKPVADREYESPQANRWSMFGS